MTQPAEVTNRLDWADLIAGLRAEITLIDYLVDKLTGGKLTADKKTDRDSDRKDPHPDRDITRQAEDILAESGYDHDHHNDLDPDFDSDLETS